MIKLALLLTLLLAAPAGAQDRTIYSSLPLQGASRPQSQDMVRAMRMALAESGRTDVRYVSLDDAVADTGKWEPGQVSANARKAVSDPKTVAYIGEFNSGASAVSIPILNEAGILQISPSNTYTGLTRREGACCGDPRRYYLTGERTYGRIVPTDYVQAAALLAHARERGRKRVFVVHDGEVYGKGIANMIETRAAAFGVGLRGVQRLTRRNRDRIAKQIRGLKADAMIFAGITQNRAPALWRAVHRRNRRIDLYGSDGVAESAFTERIPRSSRSRTFITNPTLHPFAYPQPGKDFFNRFAARYGSEPEPYAIYGFEAMSLALDALARGGNTREGAVGAFFATRDRPSVLGTYSIDPMGDTTLTDYGVYRVSARGELVFSRVVAARP